MNRKIALLGIVGTFVGLAGCSDSAEKPALDSRAEPPNKVASAPSDSQQKGKQLLALKLQADGKELTLVESGRAGYTARYTNTAGLADMFVRFKSTGATVSQCHDGSGAAVRCGDVPFFAKVTKKDGGTLVQVTDIYGESCGEQEFSAEDIAAEASSDSSGAAQDDEEAACSSCSSDSNSESVSEADSDGEVCDENSTVARRDAFCQSVNDYLTNNGLASIDCSTLDTQTTFKDSKAPRDGTDVACHDIWEPAYEQVTVWLKTCPSEDQRATQWHEVVRWQLLQEGACSHSPIVLDLDGNGFLASTPENGARFDLLGTGVAVQTAWPEGADAFLALDRDGNGRIDGSTELFGNSTRGAHWDDGFAALAELDTNEDGKLDARDSAYAELVLWRDVNHDGQSSTRELTSLHDAGIRSLYLSAARISGANMFDANRNQIPLIAGFEYEDGRKGAMADIFLRFKP